MTRGSVLCANCNTARHTGTCPKCGANLAYIRIIWDGKPWRYWKDKKGKTFRFDDAVATLREINQRIEGGIFRPEEYTADFIDENLFEKSYERWIAKKEREEKKGELAPETLRPYKSYGRNYFTYFHGKDIREIKLKHLEAFYDQLPEHLSSKYRKNMMDCLHAFFHWLWKHDENGLKDVPEFPEVKVKEAKIMRPISYEEQVQCIMNLPEHHRDIFWFMRETGVRITEACAVMPSDIDFDRQRALIQRNWSGAKLQSTTKGNKKEWIALSDQAIGIVRNNLKAIGKTFLFVNPQTKGPYRDEFLRRLWKKYSGCSVTLKEAMRHSTLSDWANNGANAFKIKEQARHTDIRTSDNYVKNAKEGLFDMVNRKNVVSLGKLGGGIGDTR